MQDFVCQGDKPIIPSFSTNGMPTRHKLVLLNCGHFEEIQYWEKYLEANRSNDPISCPYDNEHYFPYVIRDFDVASTGRRENLELSRNKWRSNLIINPGQLVLLNCGHYLQEDCWKIYRDKEPLCCPFDPSHKFPVVILGLKLHKEIANSWPDLVNRRSARLADPIQWMASAFDPAKRLQSYQITYGQNRIEENYRDFFHTLYYQGLLSLSLANLNRVLQWTIHNEEVEILQKVLPYVRNLTIPFDQDMNILHLASLIGNSEIVKSLLDGVKIHFPIIHHVLVNETTNMRLNALHYAVRQLRYSVARILLDNGINPNQLDGYTGRSPLAYAIERCSLPLAGLLVASEMTDLSVIWRIQNGFRPDQLAELTYEAMVSHYLGEGFSKEEKEFLEVFRTVVSQYQDKKWHFLDREANDKILTIHDIVTNAHLCEVSFLEQATIQTLLDTNYEYEITRDDLCEELIYKDYSEISQRIIPTLQRYNITCLICSQPFTELEDIITSYNSSESESYNLLSCGLIHRVCPNDIDPGFVKCQMCQGWIIDGLSQKLITYQNKYFLTIKDTYPLVSTIDLSQIEKE